MCIGYHAANRCNLFQSDTSLFTFDTLETIQFIPSPEFTRICITNPAVKRFLEKSRYRKPVYIITGIKTARGAKAKTTSTRSGSIGLKVGTDGSLSGTPISLGPSVNEQKASKQSAGWESGSDFVFAFRVRKVLVKKKAGTVKLEEDYAKGAMFEKEVSIGIKEPELEIVFDGEVNVEGEGLDYKELFDEDEMVCCVKPA